MSYRPDSLDGRLLDLLQAGFPLCVRPYLAVARAVGCSEAEVLERIRRLRQARIVRQISPIFDSSRIGYRSTLAAFRVEPERVGNVAAFLNCHPGISHNYLRDGRYNIWFTLTVPDLIDIEAEVARLAGESDVERWLYLPAIKTFRVGLNLAMSQDERRAGDRRVVRRRAASPETAAIDCAFVRATQDDLPLVSRPFRSVARSLGITEGAVVERLREYQTRGIIRRVAAILRPVEAGYTTNVMVAWDAPPDRIDAIGGYAAQQSAVSHCYQRPSSPDWPYSVYTMIHGRSLGDCKTIISRIADTTGVTRYIELPTVREFKKVRVRYF